MPYIQFRFKSDPLKGIFFAGLIGMGIISVGTVGYMVIEDMTFLNALYMTVITLSTVGYKEVHDLGSEGKVFTIFLILSGVGLLGFMISVIVQLVVEGHFREHVLRRKMQKDIQQLEQHALIAGYGRVGRQVAAEFSRRGAPFVIIERAEDVGDNLMQSNHLYLIGDATNDETLRLAGIERAATLISTLPDSAQNVYLVLSARHLNPGLRIVARADSTEHERKLRRAGADQVVIPHELGGTRMALGVLRPNVLDFMLIAQAGDSGLVVEELRLSPKSPLVGKTLADTNLRQSYGVMLVGLKKPNERMALNPATQTVIEVDDTMIVIGQSEDLERLNRAI